MSTSTMMPIMPGELRDGPWRSLGDVGVRLSLVRGFDCRLRCEHVPPKPNEGGMNHGQHCDEWHFAARTQDRAILLVCFSWIRDGRPVETLAMRATCYPPIYGAYLSLHLAEGDGDRQACDLLERRFCYPEVLSAFAAERMWGKEESRLLEPLAMASVDEIDLEKVFDALTPFWPALVARLRGDP